MFQSPRGKTSIAGPKKEERCGRPCGDNGGDISSFALAQLWALWVWELHTIRESSGRRESIPSWFDENLSPLRLLWGANPYLRYLEVQPVPLLRSRVASSNYCLARVSVTVFTRAVGYVTELVCETVFISCKPFSMVRS